MDQDRFGRLTRAIGQATSRRAALGAVVAAAAAAAAAAVPGLAAAAPAPEGNLIPGCRLAGQRCRKKENCCTGKCKGDRCACVNKGGSCLVTLAPGLPPAPVHANCCSNRCDNSGKCH